MKVLICETPGKLVYSEREMPSLKNNESLVRIKRIGICGTDLHAFDGTQPYFSYPRILGHELSCEIIDANGAPGFEDGEVVTAIPYLNCGVCIACRSEKPNCCVKMNVLGVHIDGGMTEYLNLPSYSLVHGEGLNDDELALVEPLAIGAHAVRRANILPEEYVLVIGAGPIGLGVMEFAKIAGAKVIAMDINDKRLQFCSQKLGVEHTVNPLKGDAINAIATITNGDMPTVVIDATGSSKAITDGFNYIAHGGRYVLVGLQKGEIRFSHPDFHKREATLMSSRNATRADFDHVIESMKSGLIRPSDYITHRVMFNGVKDQFEDWLDPDLGVIKAMVEF